MIFETIAPIMFCYQNNIFVNYCFSLFSFWNFHSQTLITYNRNCGNGARGNCWDKAEDLSDYCSWTCLMFEFVLVYVFTLVWNNKPDEDNDQPRHTTLICMSHSCACSNSLLSVWCLYELKIFWCSSLWCVMQIKWNPSPFVYPS